MSLGQTLLFSYIFTSEGGVNGNQYSAIVFRDGVRLHSNMAPVQNSSGIVGKGKQVEKAVMTWHPGRGHEARGGTGEGKTGVKLTLGMV